jgi:hypothetical protein
MKIYFRASRVASHVRGFCETCQSLTAIGLGRKIENLIMTSDLKVKGNWRSFQEGSMFAVKKVKLEGILGSEE